MGGLLSAERVPIRLAYGRILRESIQADRPFPAYDRVTMDGIAVRWNPHVRSWKRSGTQFAGDPASSLPCAESCIEVMTGTPLPSGADTVIPIEDLDFSGDQISLKNDVSVESGQFLHRQGSDASEGEPIAAPPQFLDSRFISLCATVGKTELLVSRMPKIALLMPGNELVDPGEFPQPHQVRRSNDQLIRGELAKCAIPIFKEAFIGDDPAAITQHLMDWSQDCDLILTSGGISKGKADYLPRCIRVAGFEVIFHGIMQKPGGPGLLARSATGCNLLAIPGNPVSTLVFARVYLREWLARRYGHPQNCFTLPWAEEPPCPGDKARWLPCKLESDPQHGCRLRAVAASHSADMLAVLPSDGLALLPSSGEACCGATRFYPWTS
jgi:molybdopterin molybdotransferase